MDISPDLHALRRQALLSLIDLDHGPGRLALYGSARPVPGSAPGDDPLVAVTLAYPCGIVTDSGVALSVTEYGQALRTGEAVWARITRGSGAWVADFSVGLAGDDQTPDMILPARKIFAGARVRIGFGATIVCD